MQKYFPEIFFVEVSVNGKKEVLKITFDKDFKFDDTDIEMLQDIIVIAVNDALKKVDAEIEEKLGKYGSGLSGLM